MRAIFVAAPPARRRRRRFAYGLDRIRFDTASTSEYQTGSTYSWSHTCTGNNRFLRVDIAMLSVAGSTVASITYNGVALSLIRTQSSAVGAVRIECWGLVAPAYGTNTIAVTLSTTIASVGNAESYTGVHQISPYEGSAGATATNVGAADATVNVTTTADNDLIVNAMASDDASVGPVGTGQINENNNAGALGTGASARFSVVTTPPSTVATYWTGVGTAATWSIIGYALRPAAASALAINWTISISDNMAVTDTSGFSRLANANRLYSDNFSMSDVYSRKANAARIYSDSLGIPIETFTRLANANRLYADNLAFNETWVRIASANRVYSDSLTLSEVWGRKANAARVYSDSLGIIETLARVASASRLLTDNLGMRVDYATIAFDATSTSGYQAAQSSYSWSHTCNGDFLEVDVEVLSTDAASVFAITFNGVALTRIKAVSDSGNSLVSEMWGLVAPPIGTFTIQVDLGASVISVSNANSYKNVDQQIPYEGAVRSSVAADPSITVITTVANSWIVASVSVQSDIVTGVGAGQTLRQNVNGAQGTGAVSDYVATAVGTFAQTFTNVATGQKVGVGCALRPQPIFWRRANANRVYTDNLGISEIYKRKANASRIYSDNLGLNETFVRIASASRVYSDNVGITEAYARLANASRAVSDNLGISETFARIASALRLVTDNLAITDSAILSLIGAGSLIIHCSDNFGLVDSFSRQATAYRVLSENLGLLDAVARIADANRAVADNLGIPLETVARIANANRLAIDNLGWAEAGFARIAHANRLVQDNVAFSETYYRIANARRRVSDNLGITEEIVLQVIQSGIIIVDFVDGNTNVWFSEARPLTYESEERSLVFTQVAPTSEQIAPVELEKYDAESRKYDFDFTDHPEILEGETIVSATVTATPTGLTLGAQAISGAHVYKRISGGGDGEYLLTCELVTSNADIVVGYGRLVTRTEPISQFVQRKVKYTSESREYIFDLSNFTELGTTTIALTSLNSTPPTGLSFGSLDIDGSTLTCRIGSGTIDINYLLQLDVTTLAGDTLQDFFYLQIEAAPPSNLQTVLREFDHESRLYDFDFSDTPEFESGVTIGSSQVVTMTPSMFITTLALEGARIQVRIDEPTASTTYSLVCTITTSGGDTLKAFGRLHVAVT